MEELVGVEVVSRPMLAEKMAELECVNMEDL